MTKKKIIENKFLEYDDGYWYAQEMTQEEYDEIYKDYPKDKIDLPILKRHDNLVWTDWKKFVAK